MRNVAAGERVAGISAFLLLASMFLDWFVVSIPESLGVEFFVAGTGQSAWDALDFLPIVLVVTVVAALLMSVFPLAGASGRIRLFANAVVAVLGTVSVLLILFRVVDPPGFGSFKGVFGRAARGALTVEYGIFVGLLAAAGVACGAVWAMREEGGRRPGAAAGSSSAESGGRS